MELDLETLKQVKLIFDIQSDHSTMCNGYISLCKIIEESENKDFSKPSVVGLICTCINYRETPIINGKYICSNCNKPIINK